MNSHHIQSTAIMPQHPIIIYPNPYNEMKQCSENDKKVDWNWKEQQQQQQRRHLHPLYINRANSTILRGKPYKKLCEHICSLISVGKGFLFRVESAAVSYTIHGALLQLFSAQTQYMRYDLIFLNEHRKIAEMCRISLAHSAKFVLHSETDDVVKAPTLPLQYYHSYTVSGMLWA